MRLSFDNHYYYCYFSTTTTNRSPDGLPSSILRLSFSLGGGNMHRVIRQKSAIVRKTSPSAANPSRYKSQKRLTSNNSIGAFLHSTANCLLDCSSFQNRCFYLITTTTSIIATDTTTTATAPAPTTTRRPSLRDICLTTTTTANAQKLLPRDLLDLRPFENEFTKSEMITYYTPSHHHPPTNQPLLHVHSCLIEVSQPPQEIIDPKPQPRSPFTFGLPRETLDANGSILHAGRKTEK